MSQLPLPFVGAVNAQHGFANFVVGANSELVAQLRETQGPPVLWIWGGPAVGKSHLAHAACHWHLERGAKVAYVPLASAPLDPEVVDGLASYDLVVLDDLQRWLDHFGLERALMGLYEGLVADGRRLVATAAQPPAQCRFGLHDLGSRMNAALTYELRKLDDQGKGLVISNRAKQRGLVIADRVLDFWLAHSERSLSRLLEDFERLDRAALVGQRRLTVPLVKQVLGF